MSPEYDEDRALEEAADWWQKLRSTEANDQAGFDAWLNADARHKQAFDAICEGWGLIDEVQTAPEMLSYRAEALSQAQRLGAQRWQTSRPINRRAMAAGLTVALTIPIAGIFAVSRASAQEFTTKIGEQKTVRLSDGSAIYVDANSSLRVEYSKSRRRITLKQGRAQFEVTKDPSRPFLVEASDTTVTAIGTVFSVERRKDTISIVLAEGRVHVQTAGYESQMDPNETLLLVPGAQPQLVRAVDLDRAMSWRRGQLVFENTTLSEAAERMNNYALTQISIDDPEVGALRISGVFTAGKTMPFVRAITAYLPVAFNSDGNRVTLTLRETK